MTFNQPFDSRGAYSLWGWREFANIDFTNHEWSVRISVATAHCKNSCGFTKSSHCTKSYRGQLSPARQCAGPSIIVRTKPDAPSIQSFLDVQESHVLCWILWTDWKETARVPVSVPVPVLNPINQSVLLCPSGAQPCSALLGMLGAPSAKCLEPLQGTHPAAVCKGDVALVPPRTTTATANGSRSNQKQQQDREEKRTGRGGGGGRRRATTINDNGKFRLAMVQPVFGTALYDDVCLAYIQSQFAYIDTFHGCFTRPISHSASTAGSDSVVASLFGFGVCDHAIVKKQIETYSNNVQHIKTYSIEII